MLTSRSAYALIHESVKLRLPCLAIHASILSLLGFRDFDVLAPCTLSDQEIDGLSPKDHLRSIMTRWGCPNKASEKVSDLKGRFKLFVRNPPPRITASQAWVRLAPIILSAMILKPLDDTKIKSLRCGVENEKKVLDRLREDLKPHFNNNTLSIGPTYRIGLASSPEAARTNVATSVDAIQND